MKAVTGKQLKIEGVVVRVNVKVRLELYGKVKLDIKRIKDSSMGLISVSP